MLVIGTLVGLTAGHLRGWAGTILMRFTDLMMAFPTLVRAICLAAVVARLRLQSGEVDVPGDGIPPAKFTEVTGDPALATRVIEGCQLQTGCITLDVTLPPFDDVAVRQAINMAIDKDRIDQIINGRAVPATLRRPKADRPATRT